ncbi:MAG TPA: hypothetical protein VKU86_01180 [Acidimicrobiales bacterium]|nr:hypothetical protein [Acidimicrobiales bacterium]
MSPGSLHSPENQHRAHGAHGVHGAPDVHGGRRATASPEVVSVRPDPEPPVLAAIVAAVEEAWPRPAPPPDATTSRSSSWRFSGRWWTLPAAARRIRPVRL